MTSPVAQKRHWRAIWITAVVVGLFVVTLVISIMSIGRKPDAGQTEKPSGGSSINRLPDRDFSPPAPPPSPPPAPPPSPPPRQPAPKAPTKPVTAVPVKPMTSMFQTTTDATAFDSKRSPEVGGRDDPAAAIAALAGTKDERPGTSEASRFLEKAGTGGKDFVMTPFLPPISRYMLQAGVIIPATTLVEVNSDLPGDIVAMINDDVRDTPTGEHVLIPATAKLYGRYSDELRYGQSRAQISWVRILFPDGSSQNIGSMGGTDAAGAAGVEGEVDRHPWSMAGAVGISALMTMLGQVGALAGGDSGTTNTNIGSVGVEGGTREMQSIGREFVTRELDRPNTLWLRRGAQVAVMLTRDLALPPYDMHPDWRTDN